LTDDEHEGYFGSNSDNNHEVRKKVKRADPKIDEEVLSHSSVEKKELKIEIIEEKESAIHRKELKGIR
jgi:hypothetical protein